MLIFKKRIKTIKTKVLSGKEIADYIKLNQAKWAKFLVSKKCRPNLHIIVAIEGNLPIEKYIKYKSQYGKDIGVDVVVHRTKCGNLKSKINELNTNKSVSAIILQLPIQDANLTEEALNLIEPNKDVDGLSVNSNYDPATAIAILWLMAGHNIEMLGKKIYLVGRGKLVGGPLSNMLQKSNFEHRVITSSDDINIISDGDIIISATGKPGIITSNLLKPGAILIDAGTVAEDGVIMGDASSELYSRNDISITPKIGGVGPLTISALFDNVLNAAEHWGSLK